MVADIIDAQVPLGLVQYVQRTKNHVILDDACEAGMFTHEPYVRHMLIKSVLCVPVLNQSKLVGIIYLDNRYESLHCCESLEVYLITT